ncbi:MAG: hypothetical protein K2G11_01365 [Muribaculaceae bacterium]|nr:hypothetical protein [Muribaculaceae bacterium]
MICEISKEYFKVIDFEDAAVADFTTLLHIVIISAVFSDFQFAGGKHLNVTPTSVKIVSQEDTISEFENRVFRFAVGRFA